MWPAWASSLPPAVKDTLGAFSGENARDAGEVRGDGDARPCGAEHTHHGVYGAVAKLDDQHAAGNENSRRLLEQRRVELEAFPASKERLRRLVVANFGRQPAGRVTPHIRRIADD